MSATLLLSACGDSQADIDNASRQLEEKCTALTESDGEGRVYKAYIGKANYKKTRTSMEHVSRSKGFSGSYYTSVIVLERNGKEVVTFGESGRTEQEHIKYDNAFNDTFYKVKEYRSKDKYIWGVCAYKNEHGQLLNSIETLIQIGRQ